MRLRWKVDPGRYRLESFLWAYRTSVDVRVGGLDVEQLAKPELVILPLKRRALDGRRSARRLQAFRLVERRQRVGKDRHRAR